MELSINSVIANPSKCWQFGTIRLVGYVVSHYETFIHFLEGRESCGCWHNFMRNAARKMTQTHGARSCTSLGLTLSVAAFFGSEDKLSLPHEKCSYGVLF